MMFATMLVVFYQSAHTQITAAVISSLFVLMYLASAKPYKHSILNKFVIFDEICFFFGCVTLFFFSESKLDVPDGLTSDVEDYTGWVLVVIIGLVTGINFAYLLPVKVYESYKAVKAFFLYICNLISNKIHPKNNNIKKLNYPDVDTSHQGNHAMKEYLERKGKLHPHNASPENSRFESLADKDITQSYRK